MLASLKFFYEMLPPHQCCIKNPPCSKLIYTNCILYNTNCILYTKIVMRVFPLREEYTVPVLGVNF